MARFPAFLASAALAALLLPVPAVAEGVWVLRDIRTWPYAPQPDPPPRANVYRQSVSGGGIEFTVITTDTDGKQHPHVLSMTWKMSAPDEPKGGWFAAPGDVGVSLGASHSGDTYTSAAFQIRAGEDPRQHAAGWLDRSTTVSWTYRGDPVAAVDVGNNTGSATGYVRFPDKPQNPDLPFTLLFTTGIQGTAGTEYLFFWQPAAPDKPVKTLPAEVVYGP